MTDSNNTHDEETRRVHNDCVEGDTASEGDTSDEEDIEASKKQSTRRSSYGRKEGLELPSGASNDACRIKRRKPGCLALAIVALVVTASAIAVGINAMTKMTKNPNGSGSSSSPILEEEFASASSISVYIPTSSNVNVEDENDSLEANSNIPSTVEEEENNDLWESEMNIPQNDALGLLEEMVNYEEKEDKSSGKKKDKKQSELEEDSSSIEEEKDTSTKWPSLVGMTGDEAKAELKSRYGSEKYNIYILHENDATTRDYRTSRIRIFTNDEGIVSKVPRIG